MDRLRDSICDECDSEILFMNGSRCAACLSALHAQEGIMLPPEENVTFFDPVTGVQHKGAAEPPLRRVA
jgi:hypothetical protein